MKDIYKIGMGGAKLLIRISVRRYAEFVWAREAPSRVLGSATVLYDDLVSRRDPSRIGNQWNGLGLFLRCNALVRPFFFSIHSHHLTSLLECVPNGCDNWRWEWYYTIVNMIGKLLFLEGISVVENLLPSLKPYACSRCWAYHASFPHIWRPYRLRYLSCPFLFSRCHRFRFLLLVLPTSSCTFRVSSITHRYWRRSKRRGWSRGTRRQAFFYFRK